MKAKYVYMYINGSGTSQVINLILKMLIARVANKNFFFTNIFLIYCIIEKNRFSHQKTE